MEDEVEEDVMTPAYDVVLLTTQAEEALCSAHQQLNQVVLAASLSTSQPEAVRRRAAEEVAAA